MTGVRRRRAYLPLAAALLCLFCPAHVLSLAALFGVGAGHVQGFFHLGWEECVGITVIAVFVLVIELRHHRHHRCRHEEE